MNSDLEDRRWQNFIVIREARKRGGGGSRGWKREKRNSRRRRGGCIYLFKRQKKRLFFVIFIIRELYEFFVKWFHQVASHFDFEFRVFAILPNLNSFFLLGPVDLKQTP